MNIGKWSQRYRQGGAETVHGGTGKCLAEGSGGHFEHREALLGMRVDMPTRTKLRRRELNPGLLRDRREYSPLYYSGYAINDFKSVL